MGLDTVSRVEDRMRTGNVEETTRIRRNSCGFFPEHVASLCPAALAAVTQ